MTWISKEVIMRVKALGIKLILQIIPNLIVSIRTTNGGTPLDLILSDNIQTKAHNIII